MIATTPSAPPLKAIVFDAYDTMFDVHSIAGLAEQLRPERGDALSQTWCAKQLDAKLDHVGALLSDVVAATHRA